MKNLGLNTILLIVFFSKSFINFGQSEVCDSFFFKKSYADALICYSSLNNERHFQKEIQSCYDSLHLINSANKNVDYYLNKYILSISEEKIDSSTLYLKVAFDLDSIKTIENCPSYFFEIGEYLIEKEMYNQAILNYTKHLFLMSETNYSDEFSDEDITNYKIVYCYYQKKELHESLYYFNKITSDNSLICDQMYFKGLCLMELNKNEEAKKTLLTYLNSPYKVKFKKEAKNLINGL